MSSSSSESRVEGVVDPAAALAVKCGSGVKLPGGSGEQGLALARGLGGLLIHQGVKSGGFALPGRFGMGATSGGGGGQACGVEELQSEQPWKTATAKPGDVDGGAGACLGGGGTIRILEVLSQDGVRGGGGIGWCGDGGWWSMFGLGGIGGVGWVVVVGRNEEKGGWLDEGGGVAASCMFLMERRCGSGEGDAFNHGVEGWVLEWKLKNGGGSLCAKGGRNGNMARDNEKADADPAGMGKRRRGGGDSDSSGSLGASD